MTVGKTHSGKTTFARNLEQQLNHSLVIDQDNHAEFINTHYKKLLPAQGPNTIKYKLTQAIVDFAVSETSFHLIISNSNRNYQGRSDLLTYFHKNKFKTILVNFDIPDQVLQARIAESQRSTKVFRSATTFEEVLIRQQTESEEGKVTVPSEDEADYLFVIRKTEEWQSTMQRIIEVIQAG